MLSIAPDQDEDAAALREALAGVRDAIARAAAQSGRSRADVTLVAASKTVPPQRLQQAIDLGQTVFGENRVQEAQDKWPDLRLRNPQVDLHLIGGLQSNKVRDAVALFDVIQSIDRPSLARALAIECDRQGRWPRLFLQVNTAGEAQKGGVAPREVDALVRSCRDMDLDVVGLMCIPPVDRDAAADFALLQALAAANGLARLSMGMSSDFAQAIVAGATDVRVGSALFGRRPAPVAAH